MLQGIISVLRSQVQSHIAQERRSESAIHGERRGEQITTALHHEQDVVRGIKQRPNWSHH